MASASEEEENLVRANGFFVLYFLFLPSLWLAERLVRVGHIRLFICSPGIRPQAEQEQRPRLGLDVAANNTALFGPKESPGGSGVWA